MTRPATQVDTTQNDGSEREGRSERQIRNVASWIAIIGTSLLAAFFFGFIAYQSVLGPGEPGNWFTRVLETQFAATVGVPLSVVSAACLVLLLKATMGPIEFEALGFKFRGASAPIVLWIFCFLAIISGMKLLWQ
jgi:hypothetical protein